VGRVAVAQSTVPAAAATLFSGPIRMIVQSPVEAHQTKKRSGSSDGAMTHDTPIT
jgi:hypothetical protein